MVSKPAHTITPMRSECERQESSELNQNIANEGWV